MRLSGRSLFSSTEKFRDMTAPAYLTGGTSKGGEERGGVGGGRVCGRAPGYSLRLGHASLWWSQRTSAPELDYPVFGNHSNHDGGGCQTSNFSKRQHAPSLRRGRQRLFFRVEPGVNGGKKGTADKAGGRVTCAWSARCAAGKVAAVSGGSEGRRRGGREAENGSASNRIGERGER